MPSISAREIGDFEREWLAWWNSMQPAWREKSSNGKWECGMYGEDWGSL